MSKAKSIQTIYEEILNNKVRRFPPETWSHPKESKTTLIKLIRYAVLEKLKWDRTDFCDNFCLKVIIRLRLNTGFLKAYNRNTIPLAIDAFPEWNIKAWEMKKSKVPEGFWSEETAAEATRWLVEKRLVLSLDEVQTDIANSHFHNNNLGGMLITMKMGAIDAVVLSYPDYDWTYLIERVGYVITKSQAQEIRDLYASGTINQRQIAFKFDLNPSQVHLIVNGKAFK